MTGARTLIRTRLILSIDLSFCEKRALAHSANPSGDVTLAAAFIKNHHPCGGCACMIVDILVNDGLR